MDRYLQFLIFFTILASILGFMQWYLLRAYLSWLQKVATDKGYVVLRAAGMYILFAGNLIFLLRFPSTEMGWYQSTLFQYLIIYPGGVFFGIIVTAFILLLLTHSVSGLYRIGSRVLHRSGPVPPASNQAPAASDPASASDPVSASSNPASPSDPALRTDSSDLPLINRRQFLKTTGAAAIAAPALLTVGASAATSHDYRIIRKSLYFPDLPLSLNGLKIVQISDIHSGIYMTENQMRDIFALANEQHPDLVTITGDFVDNSISEIPALYRAIPDLKAEYGIYGCLGNHDHYASASSVTSALRQRNVDVLTNDHKTLTINGESLTLIGVDDAVTGQTDAERFRRATRNIPENGFRILLSHRPDLFDEAVNHDVNLTLSGHTHGGQIGFNILGLPLYPIYLFQKYPKGLFRQGDQQLYVNVGIGMVGIPIRTVRPELTVLELTNRKAAYPDNTI